MSTASRLSTAHEERTVDTKLTDDGYVICEQVLSAATVERFRKLVDNIRRADNVQNVANSSGTYGLRNLTDVMPQASELLREPKLVSLVQSVLGADAFMTRATLFDKTPGANWGVFWHQDLSIAVQQKHDVPGFNAWTRKAGIDCVQPPLELMSRVLAVRLHLDDCHELNGALRVLPGTHNMRRMDSDEIEQQRESVSEVVCAAAAGDGLLMKPLLLHASSPMSVEASRRVVHFEFAALDLPHPLEWKYRLPVGQ